MRVEVPRFRDPRRPLLRSVSDPSGSRPCGNARVAQTQRLPRLKRCPSNVSTFITAQAGVRRDPAIRFIADAQLGACPDLGTGSAAALVELVEPVGPDLRVVLALLMNVAVPRCRDVRLSAVQLSNT
jgi:hypothetical protein